MSKDSSGGFRQLWRIFSLKNPGFSFRAIRRFLSGYSLLVWRIKIRPIIAWNRNWLKGPANNVPKSPRSWDIINFLLLWSIHLDLFIKFEEACAFRDHLSRCSSQCSEVLSLWVWRHTSSSRNRKRRSQRMPFFCKWFGTQWELVRSFCRSSKSWELRKRAILALSEIPLTQKFWESKRKFYSHSNARQNKSFPARRIRFQSLISNKRRS